MCLSGLTRTTRTHDVFARASLRVGVSFDLPGFGLVKADNWLDDTGTVIEFASFGLFEKCNLQVTFCDWRGFNLRQQRQRSSWFLGDPHTRHFAVQVYVLRR